MSTVLRINNADFSNAGLGQVKNTPILKANCSAIYRHFWIGTPNGKFTLTDATGQSKNWGWGQSCAKITIPENTKGVAGMISYLGTLNAPQNPTGSAGFIITENDNLVKSWYRVGGAALLSNVKTKPIHLGSAGNYDLTKCEIYFDFGADYTGKDLYFGWFNYSPIMTAADSTSSTIDTETGISDYILDFPELYWVQE